MIFVTVGNHHQGFERLLKKIDEIAPAIPDEIIIQKGYSRYLPKNAKYFDFVPLAESEEYIKKSNLVISHAGIGTIILCKNNGIPIIIIPRRKKFGEHGTDHQIEIAKALEERQEKGIFVLYEEQKLPDKINQILSCKDKLVPKVTQGRLKLIETIRNFIENQNPEKANK